MLNALAQPLITVDVQDGELVVRWHEADAEEAGREELTGVGS